MTRVTGSDCAVMCNLMNVHTYRHYKSSVRHTHTRPGQEEDTARLGQADTRRLGGRHAGRTDLIPLR